MKEILDIIHNTIYQFFDVCDEDEEVPISDKDKLLLEVNKAICNNLKALEQEPSENWYDVPSDEMTLKQARQAVKDLRKKLAECLEQEPCGDAISRQAAINCLGRSLIVGSETDPEQVRLYFQAVVETLYSVPSVAPTQRIGHWILSRGGTCFECSECGIRYKWAFNFCPKCGADMRDAKMESEVEE